MKFPSLPAASTLDGTEVSPLTQGGVDKRTTAQAIANLFKGTKGADIASAATTSIGAATGMFVHVTGTTTITSFGTGTAGWLRFVRFAGVLTLTHNATSLILPTGANITTAAGDCAIFVSEGSSNWRCLGYFRANGMPLTADTDTTLSADSDTKVPTQKAVKAYIDGIGALTTADIGVTVQAYHANLAALAGLALEADKLPYGTGAGALALATFTAFARTLVAAADAATARTALGAAGSDVVTARNTVSALDIDSSGIVNIDYALGDYFTLTLDDDVNDWTFSNLPGAGKGCTVMVHITQGSTPRTVAWPASFLWADGTAGEVSTGDGDIDVLALTTFDNGTTWNATLAKAFA